MRLPSNLASVSSLVLLALFLQFSPYPRGVYGQAEILSISSFNECINIDPSSLSSNGDVGKGKFLDCSSGDPKISDTVTVMDLRLLAGTTGPEEFIISLTTLKAADSASQSSNDPKGCVADTYDDGGIIPTDCQLTNSTYAIHIDNTEFIYYYDLTLDKTFDIPYCHLIHIADTSTAACNNPVYKGFASQYSQYTSSCDARVQEVTSCTGGGGTGIPDSDIAECAYWMDRFSSDRIYDILTGKATNGSLSPYVNEYYSAHVSSAADCLINPGEKRCLRTEFSSDILRKRGPPTYNPNNLVTSWDDFASAELGEIFLGAAWTDHTLAPPDPIPWGLDQSGAFNPDGKLQILNCVGTCDANKQNCYNGYGAPGEIGSLRANGTTLESGGVDIGLFGLGPECGLYRAALLPQIAMRVTMTVTDLSDPMAVPVVVTTDNVRPGSQESDPLQLIGFNILSVGSLNNILGPPLGGVFMMCGSDAETFSVNGLSYAMNPTFDLLDPLDGQQKYANDFFLNMRTQMAPDESVDDVLYNPWDNIVKQAELNDKPTNGYYPSNRYMSYNAVCDANGGTIENDSGRTCPSVPTEGMWYYIAPENLGTIGRGCNQIGITDSYWNVAAGAGQQLVSQFAADVCNSDPFICVPGFPANIQTQAVNTTGSPVDINFIDNLSVTGCMAAGAFEILHDTGVDGGPSSLYGYFRKDPSLTGKSGLSNNEQRYSENMVKKMQRDNLPPGYNLQMPNYWFQKESGTKNVGEYRAYYKPVSNSGAKTQVNKKQVGGFPLSFEMIVYFVGKFVGYGQIVPSGYFNQTGCETNPDSPQLASFGVTVTNTGKTTGDYSMELACPPSTLVEPTNSPQDFLNVAPNSTSAPLVFRVAFIAGTEGETPSDDCVLTLRPKTEVFSVLDMQPVADCDRISLNLTSNPPPAPPYVPPGHDAPESCDFCDFICWHDETAGLYVSPCFYLFVAPLVAFLSALIVLTTNYVYRRYTDSVKIKHGTEVRNRNNIETHEQIEGLLHK